MKHGIKTGVVLGSMLLSSAALANEIQVKPYTSLAYQMYDLTVRTDETNTAEGSSDYFAFGAGVTVSQGQFYADINFSTSLSAEYEISSNTADFSRNDLALAVGYKFTDQLSVFGGYKTGTSEITDFEGNTTDLSLEFKANGFFIGGSYGTALDDTLYLGGSLALAFMNGEYTEKEDGFLDFTGEGDVSVGLSLNGSITKLLSDSLSVTGFIKIQSYTYADMTYDNGGSTFDSDQDIDEDFTTLGVSLNFHY